ncbi:MAG: hypothetical protein LUF85_14030 [Bacteroides sp.]|nr:hypothetical protein [Bacteroides sp.]
MESQNTDITIESYLFIDKNHKGNLTPDLLVSIREQTTFVNNSKRLDYDYPEGAIVIKLWGKTLLGKEQWDLVDQLFMYFASAIREVKDNGYAEFSFPDNNIPVTLT